MANVIQWKQGSKFTGSAESAHKELEAIRKRDGCVTPAAVVERAKAKNSALKRHVFDCDEGKAAERYYLERARNLIRSLEIIHVQAPKEPVKAYSVVTAPSGGDAPPRKVYASTEEALQDPIQRQEILAAAIREAAAYRRKYAGLSELAKVFQAMEDVAETLAG